MNLSVFHSFSLALYLPLYTAMSILCASLLQLRHGACLDCVGTRYQVTNVTITRQGLYRMKKTCSVTTYWYESYELQRYEKLHIFLYRIPLIEREPTPFL